MIVGIDLDRDARDVYPTYCKANTLNALRRLAINNQLDVASWSRSTLPLNS
jgi:hypothetical protein